MRDVQPIGERFGRLVVTGATLRLRPSGKRVRFWAVRCDCGAEKSIRAHDVKRGHALSCGCLAIDVYKASFTVHGDKRSKSQAPEYVSWRGMVQRCENRRAPKFAHYGGRGIRMCRRWRKGENGLTGYQCFLADLGRRPSPAHSIDRKDNDGHYEPGNVRWATPAEQRSNQRPYKYR